MSRPASPRLRRAILAGGILAGLAVPSAAFAADPASTAVVLTTDNKISTFETAYPGEASTPVAVTGLTAGDTLVGIDVRPQNGALYALGRNATAGTIQLYALSTRTAVATPIGAAIAQGGTAAATQFGFDFNPTVDRIRVVSDAGLNLRLDPNTGALAGSDTTLSGGTTKLDGAAYTNDEQNATATTLYGLDASTDKLYFFGGAGPNGGVTSAGKAVTSGGGAVDFGAVGGFDIAPGNDVATSNTEAAAGKIGYAAVKANGLNLLTKIDLNTAAATAIGTIGNGTTDVQGLAIQQEEVAAGVPAVSLDGTKLRRFNTATPATGTTTAAIAGLVNGDVPQAIDWRAATGELLLLGTNDSSNSGTLYRLDPQSAVATPIGAAGSIALTTLGTTGSTTPVPIPPLPGVAVDLPADGYDIDVNPTVDRVRVVTKSGLNFRVNPTTGAPVDASPTGGLEVFGNQPDGAQNGAATDVSGTAYTNSYGQQLPVAPSTTAIGPTTQYGLSAATNQLLIQNPPNAGTQTLPQKVKVGGTELDFTSVGGFDVAPGVAATTNAAPATGSGLAVLNTGTAATSGLYAIDLTTGAATLKGALVTVPTSLAVGDGPPATKTRTPPVVIGPIVIPPITGGGGTQTPTPAPAKAGFGSSTKLTVKLRATKISSKGPAKVTFRNTNRFAVKVRIQATTPKSGKRKAIKYATKTYTVKASSSRTVNVKLPSAARKVLASKRKLTIKVTLRVTAPNGKSRTVRKTLTARKK